MYELKNEIMTKEEVLRTFEDNKVEFVDDTGYIIIGFQPHTDNLIELTYEEVGNKIKITNIHLISWWRRIGGLNELKSTN